MRERLDVLERGAGSVKAVREAKAQRKVKKAKAKAQHRHAALRVRKEVERAATVKEEREEIC